MNCMAGPRYCFGMSSEYTPSSSGRMRTSPKASKRYVELDASTAHSRPRSARRRLPRPVMPAVFLRRARRGPSPRAGDAPLRHVPREAEGRQEKRGSAGASRDQHGEHDGQGAPPGSESRGCPCHGRQGARDAAVQVREAVQRLEGPSRERAHGGARQQDLQAQEQGDRDPHARDLQGDAPARKVHGLHEGLHEQRGKAQGEQGRHREVDDRRDDHPCRRADSADVQPQRGNEEQEVDRQAGQVQERALGRDDLHRPHGQRQQEAQVAGIVQHGEGQGDRGEEDESPASQQGVEHHHLGVPRREPRSQEAPVHAHEHDSVGSQGRERAQGGDGQHPELLPARELAKPVCREPRRSPQGGPSESECRHPSSPGRASRGSRSPLPPSGAAPPAGPRRSAPRG